MLVVNQTRSRSVMRTKPLAQPGQNSDILRIERLGDAHQLLRQVQWLSRAFLVCMAEDLAKSVDTILSASLFCSKQAIQYKIRKLPLELLTILFHLLERRQEVIHPFHFRDQHRQNGFRLVSEIVVGETATKCTLSCGWGGWWDSSSLPVLKAHNLLILQYS